MRIRREGGHWLWIGGPVPPGAAAITIGRLVSIRRHAAGNRHLLRHEAEHVRQYAERGLVGFLATYVGSYLRLRLRGWGHDAAYRRIPLEVDAEWRARTNDTRGRGQPVVANDTRGRGQPVVAGRPGRGRRRSLH